MYDLIILSPLYDFLKFSDNRVEYELIGQTEIHFRSGDDEVYTGVSSHAFLSQGL